MKWKIHTYYRFDISNTYLGQIREIKRNIESFLYHRGYKQIYGEETITDLTNNQFILEYSYTGNILQILISTSNWKKNNQEQYPQIVKLIEDYLRAECQFWLYLETLNEVEINRIKKLGRDINQITIINKLKSLNINPEIHKPKVESFGEYKYRQSDIYSGTKSEFESKEGFWISFLAWYMCAELEYNDLNYVLKKGYFDIRNGACIPYETLELQKEIDRIMNKVDWFEKDKVETIYQMRKDWNDSIFLIEMKDKYLLYNWWTSE